MDHKDRNLGILGLVQHAGVEVVDLAVFDGGVRHLGDEAVVMEDIEYEIE